MADDSLSVTARILAESTAILKSSIDTLDEAIQDVPRLSKVLETEKLFGVVPLFDMKDAKKGVVSEITPQIEELKELAKERLAYLRLKKSGLESQVQLLKTKLESADDMSPQRSSRSSKERNNYSISKEIDVARLRSLRATSDRLRFSLNKYKLRRTSAKLSAIPSLPHADE